MGMFYHVTGVEKHLFMQDYMIHYLSTIKGGWGVGVGFKCNSERDFSFCQICFEQLLHISCSV